MLVPLPPRSSTARETYQRLREAILSGDIPPGSRLNERRLAEQLGVSRTPVREALAMLEAEELVVSVPGAVAAVRHVTVEELDHAYHVRALLEGYAARLAAERIASRDLAVLRGIDRRMARVLERSGSDEKARVRELAALNAEFHTTMAVISGNRVLERTLQSLIDTPLYARAFYWYSEQRKRASRAEHERMIELLESRDVELAAHFWSEHVLRGRDAVLEGLESSGLLPEAVEDVR